MEKLPNEVMDIIVDYVETTASECTQTECQEHIGKIPRHYKTCASTRYWFYHLRLVSKAFCYSASRALFRQTSWSFDDKKTIMKFEEFSASRYAIHAREISMDFNRCEKSWPLFLRSRKKLRTIMGRFTGLKAVGLSGIVTMKGFVSIENALLPSLPLGTLEELAFIFTGPWWDMQTGDNEQVFTTDVSLVHIPLEDGLKSLRHLTLKGNLRGGGDPTCCARLLQYPAELQSLKLVDCSQENILHITSKNLSQLEYLSMEGVDITRDNLLALLEKCQATIKFIEMKVVTLYGSWVPALYQIARHLRLLNFRIRLCGSIIEEEAGCYGTFEHIDGFAGSSPCMGYEAVPLYALGDIQRQVNKYRLAAGLQVFGNDTYKYLNWKPLREELIEEEWQKLSDLPCWETSN